MTGGRSDSLKCIFQGWNSELAELKVHCGILHAVNSVVIQSKFFKKVFF